MWDPCLLQSGWFCSLLHPCCPAQRPARRRSSNNCVGWMKIDLSVAFSLVSRLFCSCFFVCLIIFHWIVSIMCRTVESEITTISAWKWVYLSSARLLLWGVRSVYSEVSRVWVLLLLWVHSLYPWLQIPLALPPVWGGVLFAIGFCCCCC